MAQFDGDVNVVVEAAAVEEKEECGSVSTEAPSDPASEDWKAHLDPPTLDTVVGQKLRAMTWGEKDPQIAMEEALSQRRTILDEDRMFSSITVRFRCDWERDADDATAQARLAACEAKVRGFLLAFAAKNAGAAEQRWKGMTVTEEQLQRALEKELAVAHLREGAWHRVQFRLETSARFHRILWAIGDEISMDTFYSALQKELGPSYLVRSPVLGCTLPHLCGAGLVLLLGLLVAEACSARDSSVLEWSSRLWLICATMYEVILLLVIFSFPIREVETPFGRELCITAVYSRLGVRAMQCLPFVICIGVAAVPCQIYALGAATVPGVLAGLFSVLSIVAAFPAFNTLRCKHPDNHGNLVIVFFVFLLLLLLCSAIWLYATGHMDAGCFTVYLVTEVAILHNTKKYVDFGWSYQYEQAGVAEWRMLFLIGASLFVLGVANAPDTLLSYTACSEDHGVYACGAWRAALICFVFGLHGVFLGMLE